MVAIFEMAAILNFLVASMGFQKRSSKTICANFTACISIWTISPKYAVICYTKTHTILTAIFQSVFLWIFLFLFRYTETLHILDTIASSLITALAYIWSRLPSSIGLHCHAAGPNRHCIYILCVSLLTYLHPITAILPYLCTLWGIKTHQNFLS